MCNRFCGKKHETWVQIPPELYPKSGKFRGIEKPMCRLRMALYGHPESGAHWEQHLTEAVKHIGGEPVAGHPSSFYFAHTRMLLTVYVDDLLLSGPVENHACFWRALQVEGKIKIDEPEVLDRFLGRRHEQIIFV